MCVCVCVYIYVCVCLCVCVHACAYVSMLRPWAGRRDSLHTYTMLIIVHSDQFSLVHIDTGTIHVERETHYLRKTKYRMARKGPLCAEVSLRTVLLVIVY